MTLRLPGEARRVFERGVLCYLGVRTEAGPHLTPVVFAAHGNSLWVTTARSSVKANAWRRDPSLAGLAADGATFVTFRGRVRAYDALDPLSWPGAAVAGPRIVQAATKFSLKNARFFAGYAVDARRVPFAWAPPGRVFVEVRPESGRVLDPETGEIVAGWGEWTVGSRPRGSFAELPGRRGLDLRTPPDVRNAVGPAGPGALALSGEHGLTVLPARVRRVGSEGAYDGVLPRSFLDLAWVAGGAPAAVTVDRASRWRAADMIGLLLQGRGEVFAEPGTTRGRRELRRRIDRLGDGGALALVRVRPERAVWWRGWTSGTVSAP